MIRLRRVGDGSYAYKHFAIKPGMFDDGPRSKGHRAWTITPDPTNARPSKTLDTLYAVRDLFEAVERKDAP